MIVQNCSIGDFQQDFNRANHSKLTLCLIHKLRIDMTGKPAYIGFEFNY